ncbi:MAG: BT_3987 domain-containing protein [Flavisolibacter sp.]
MKIAIKNICFLIVVCFALASCLKDKDYENGLIQSVRSNGQNQNIIEIQLTANDTTQFLHQAFDLSNNDTVIDVIPVVLASPNGATEDIHVTLVANPSLVTAYNAANGSSYNVPSSSLYTVINPGNVVTIPKGSRVGYLQIKLKPNNFLGQDWALGYTIGSIDNASYIASGNLSAGVYAFGIKNKYEGKYHSTGYFQHPTSPRAINKDKYVSTINANTVATELGDLGSGTQINITINTDNTVNITPGSGTSGTTAAVAAISGDAVYNNTYDPATKTFYLKYGYPNPATRIITEVLKLK